MNERLQVLRRAIASLEAVKAEFFDADHLAESFYPEDERCIESALGALRRYEPRESRS